MRLVDSNLVKHTQQDAEAFSVRKRLAAEGIGAGDIDNYVNSRSGDLDINVVKEKHLTNMRSTSSDGTVQLTPATIFSLEQAIDFLEDDEPLEVTPQSLRLRKRELNRSKRKKK